VWTSFAGIAMWLLFFEQLELGFEWRPLSAWQGQTWYKIASGSVLAGFVCFQWLLALLRVNRWARAARALYPWHQTAGAFSPVLLFLHSTRLGFGYLLALGTVYVANNVLGLVSPSTFPRLKMLAPFWVIAHVALSVLLTALVVYHAWTALYYE
jgi:cytochrome b561